MPPFFIQRKRIQISDTIRFRSPWETDYRVHDVSVFENLRFRRFRPSTLIRKASVFEHYVTNITWRQRFRKPSFTAFSPFHTNTKVLGVCVRGFGLRDPRAEGLHWQAIPWSERNLYFSKTTDFVPFIAMALYLWMNTWTSWSVVKLRMFIQARMSRTPSARWLKEVTKNMSLSRNYIR